MCPAWSWALWQGEGSFWAQHCANASLEFWALVCKMKSETFAVAPLSCFLAPWLWRWQVHAGVSLICQPTALTSEHTSASKALLPQAPWHLPVRFLDIGGGFFLYSATEPHGLCNFFLHHYCRTPNILSKCYYIFSMFKPFLILYPTWTTAEQNRMESQKGVHQ